MSQPKLDPSEAHKRGVLKNARVKNSLETSSNLTTWVDVKRAVAPITWDWKSWIPRGFAVLVVGDSGEGKSAVILHSLCRPYLVRGVPWPDGSSFDGEPGEIVWGEAEAGQVMNLERAERWGLPIDKILTPFDDPLEDVLFDKKKHQDAYAGKMKLPDVRIGIIDSLRGSQSGNQNFALLKSGQVLATDLRNQIEQSGFSWDLAGRAKEKLRILSIKKSDKWYWALPYTDRGVE